jgi:hypothetical protein
MVPAAKPYPVLMPLSPAYEDHVAQEIRERLRRATIPLWMVGEHGYGTAFWFNELVEVRRR